MKEFKSNNPRIPRLRKPFSECDKGRTKSGELVIWHRETGIIAGVAGAKLARRAAEGRVGLSARGLLPHFPAGVKHPFSATKRR